MRYHGALSETAVPDRELTLMAHNLPAMLYVALRFSTGLLTLALGASYELVSGIKLTTVNFSR